MQFQDKYDSRLSLQYLYLHKQFALTVHKPTSDVIFHITREVTEYYPESSDILSFWSFQDAFKVCHLKGIWKKLRKLTWQHKTSFCYKCARIKIGKSMNMIFLYRNSSFILLSFSLLYLHSGAHSRKGPVVTSPFLTQTYCPVSASMEILYIFGRVLDHFTEITILLAGDSICSFVLGCGLLVSRGKPTSTIRSLNCFGLVRHRQILWSRKIYLYF